MDYYLSHFLYTAYHFYKIAIKNFLHTINNLRKKKSNYKRIKSYPPYPHEKGNPYEQWKNLSEFANDLGRFTIGKFASE